MDASLTSPEFLALFLPATVAAYALVPRRGRWVVLLLASWAFFWFVSTKLVVFNLLAAAATWATGLAISSIAQARDRALASAEKPDRKAIKECFGRKQNLALAAGLLVDFGLLAAFKYLAFAGEVATSLAALLGFELALDLPTFAAPIGISFYTLSAASYLVDVRRGTVEAERNPARMALFLAFFPTVVEGPILRYKEVAPQLAAGEPVSGRNLYAGTLRIAWGVVKKTLVADRVNIFVKSVFEGYLLYDASLIPIATALYVLQLYYDFSGAIDVAAGTAQIFGIGLPQNFRQPFFSRSASEFWQRWHITLGAWLRDYVYYPITLSGPCKRLTKAARKRLGNRLGPVLASTVALAAVWFANGLWHGAGSQYLFYGLYYFVVIVAGELAGVWMTALEARSERVRTLRASRMWHAFQHVRTLLVVLVGELFFRATSLSAGFAMFFRALSGATGEKGAPLPGPGMDINDFIVVFAMVIVLVILGVAKERGRDPLESICSRGFGLRLAVLAGVVLVALVFGAYGAAYTPVDPMYAQF